PPDRAASRLQRRRDDRRLDPPAVRRAGEDLEPHHQRGARGQPRRARRHLEAAGDDRVGVSLMSDATAGELTFPDVAFLVLSSRLIPDLDGGYTIATA